MYNNLIEDKFYYSNGSYFMKKAYLMLEHKNNGGK